MGKPGELPNYPAEGKVGRRGSAAVVSRALSRLGEGSPSSHRTPRLSQGSPLHSPVQNKITKEAAPISDGFGKELDSLKLPKEKGQAGFALGEPTLQNI